MNRADRPQLVEETTVADPFGQGLGVLTAVECQSALMGTVIGRLAISHDALPLILPINYAYDGLHITFRTHEGGILGRACRHSIVAFEIDEFDPKTGCGWSVSVVGVANVLYGGEWLKALELGLDGAGAGDGSVFVEITPGTIVGRWVRPRPTAEYPPA